MRTPAQKKADKTYDQKRIAPIPVRFTLKELQQMDKARGELSRSAWIKQRCFPDRSRN